MALAADEVIVLCHNMVEEQTGKYERKGKTKLNSSFISGPQSPNNKMNPFN
jgi:hypothetical protein